MQQWGNSYWGPYFPIVNMLSVRLILANEKIKNIDSKAIDFVLALPQADLEEDIWMHHTIRFQVDGQTEVESDRYYILKLNKSLYCLKQASFNCYKKLKAELADIGFNPSDIDPYLYTGNEMIILTYVDDFNIVGPSMVDIDYFVKSMKSGSKTFVLDDEVDIDKFIGIEITQLDENIYSKYISLI